jgi:diaminopimelate decarboxylase
MSPLHEIGGELAVEGVPLARIAEQFGTPCYVYSHAALVDAFGQYRAAFGARDHLVLYAVKANSNLAILNLFARLGSGFDIVSGGELARVLAAGGDPQRIVFSGVGKSVDEMRAALAADILCFNVESAAELERLSRVATQVGRTARVSLRVNPDVDAKTHPYIATGLKENKFGVPHQEALALYRRARALPGLQVAGIDCHIGSQLTEIGPFAGALERVLELADKLAADGFDIEHLDLGGGLGIRYRDETPPPIAEYIGALVRGVGARRARILVEPGRSLVGNAGWLLTRVEYMKQGEDRSFAIVDAAMNDLMRPALYDAWHDIRPVRPRAGVAPRRCEIVGPVCESGDFLGHDRMLCLEEGDLLAVLSAGAYGMSMSSNYNTRPRAPEVIVDGDRIHVVRLRESVEELFAHESVLPSE